MFSLLFLFLSPGSLNSFFPSFTSHSQGKNPSAKEPEIKGLTSANPPSRPVLQIFFSLLSSIALFTRAFTSAPPRPSWVVALPLINVLAIAAAFMHNRSFWKAKAMVPFVEGFNEGIRKSGEIRDLLVALGAGWVVVGGVGVVGG